MKILFPVCMLFFVSGFSFSQSTNRAQLKSALLGVTAEKPAPGPETAGAAEKPEAPGIAGVMKKPDSGTEAPRAAEEPEAGGPGIAGVMEKLGIEPGIIGVYKRIAGNLQKELGEEIGAGNIQSMTVSVYGLGGGLAGKKVLNILSSGGGHDIVVDENRVYVRTPGLVTIKNFEGGILAENFLNFNGWDAVIAAADRQLGLGLNWNRGYTIEGDPQIVSEDGQYLVMFFGQDAGWVVFMPGGEAKKLEF